MANMSDPIRVAVSGACGRMGREVVRAVLSADDMALVGMCDIAGSPEVSEVPFEADVGVLLEKTRPDALVVFTVPAAAMDHVRIAFAHGVRPVVGTTGITTENVDEMRALAKSGGVGALIAPNFAIGAVLMMKFAAEAAKHMPAAEIVELHHDKKLDAPSGTAIKTAEMIAAARGGAPPSTGVEAGNQASRGGEFNGIRIHSVRLPGLVAHQEVLFGGLGQTLTIRHDSLDRQSFMPGVLMAIRHVVRSDNVVYGLENIL